MGDDESPTRAAGFRTARLEAFSDGVFAIAITLLVLEISVPLSSEDDLLKALGEQWPSYLGYVVSFSTIGAVWLAHTVITEYLDHADAKILRLNLLLLLVVAFMPFPTKLLAGFADNADAERVAATVYGINLLLTMVMVSLLWRYALREHLVRPDLADDDVRTLTTRLTPSLGAYVVMILVGLLLPTVAVAGYLVIALFLLLPVSLLRHRSSPS